MDAVLDVRDSHLAEWEATEKLPETDSFQAPGLESSLSLENNQRIEGINQSPQAINLKLVEGHVMSSSKGLMVFLIFIIVLPDHCPPTSESKINHFNCNDIQQQERTATNIFKKCNMKSSQPEQS